MRFVDSHAHIDGADFDGDRDHVMRRALEAGVCAVLNVGTGDPHGDDFERALDVARQYDNVFAALGVHPHDARLYDAEAEAKLSKLLTSTSKIVALGEIGLDYHYDHSPRDAQRRAFVGQLRLARALDLPVIIHSRAADDDTVEILRAEWGGPTCKPGVMHCFGGSAETARELLDAGFFISFAGNVTFKKAENLRDAARVVPLDRLLIETDCPYLAPIPFRGRRNEPSYVTHTAQFLAQLKNVDLPELAAATTANFQRAFGLNL